MPHRLLLGMVRCVPEEFDWERGRLALVGMRLGTWCDKGKELFALGCCSTLQENLWNGENDVAVTSA